MDGEAAHQCNIVPGSPPFTFPIMPCFMLLLLLLAYCSGVRSLPTLTQQSSASVSVQNTARLSCTLSSGYQSYEIEWYQQRGGQAPRLLLYRDSNRASGVPDLWLQIRQRALSDHR
ncbi:hypothetical protein lerEdw1_003692 [Lerista edwardsae]|nr:hypothetical protein lerEdw1_003692 [Lerista edwardsae]